MVFRSTFETCTCGTGPAFFSSFPTSNRCAIQTRPPRTRTATSEPMTICFFFIWAATLCSSGDNAPGSNLQRRVRFEQLFLKLDQLNSLLQQVAPCRVITEHVSVPLLDRRLRGANQLFQQRQRFFRRSDLSI